MGVRGDKGRRAWPILLVREERGETEVEASCNGSRVEGGGQAGLEEKAVGGDREDEASTSTLY